MKTPETLKNVIRNAIKAGINAREALIPAVLKYSNRTNYESKEFDVYSYTLELIRAEQFESMRRKDVVKYIK